MPELDSQPQRKQWHLDKTVSVTHLVSTFVGITTVAIFMSRQDTRITLLESVTATQQRDTSDFKAQVREDLREISKKLDRLIERK